MRNSKPDADNKAKREKAKPSRPASSVFGYRKLLATGCLALSLVCAAPLILSSPHLHWQIDHYIKPPIITPAPAGKESDMIAFICVKYRDYPRNKLHTIYPDGSHLREIRHHRFERYRNIKWSPDGIWIATSVSHAGENLWGSDADEIYRVRFDGLDSKRLTYNYYKEFFPQWSDDGGSISFVSEESIHQISVNGHEISRFDIPHNNFGLLDRRFAWSSDSRKYVFGISDLYYGTHHNWSDVRVLKEAQNQSWSYRIQGLEWAPNNEQILYHDSDEALFVYNVKRKAGDFSVNMDLTFDARWSPDGNWIAIVGQAENVESGIYLYLLDVQTGGIQKLTSDDMDLAWSISWSPDSEWIAFADSEYSFGDEKKYISRLFKIRRDGTDLQQLKELDCKIYKISWSPK